MLKSGEAEVEVDEVARRRRGGRRMPTRSTEAGRVSKGWRETAAVARAMGAGRRVLRSCRVAAVRICGFIGYRGACATTKKLGDENGQQINRPGSIPARPSLDHVRSII